MNKTILMENHNYFQLHPNGTFFQRTFEELLIKRSDEIHPLFKENSKSLHNVNNDIFDKIKDKLYNFEIEETEKKNYPEYKLDNFKE